MASPRTSAAGGGDDAVRRRLAGRSGSANELQAGAVGVLSCLAQSTQLQHLLDGDRPPKMESLSELATRHTKRGDLLHALDAFSDAPKTQRITHPNDGASC